METVEATNTPTESRADLETAIRELEEISRALDGTVGGEFADGVLIWLTSVERVQRLTRSWDAIKSPDEQVGEALHARLQGVTPVFGVFSTRGSRPRSFQDFAARATSRARKACEEKE